MFLSRCYSLKIMPSGKHIMCHIPDHLKARPGLIQCDRSMPSMVLGITKFKDMLGILSTRSGIRCQRLNTWLSSSGKLEVHMMVSAFLLMHVVLVQ